MKTFLLAAGLGTRLRPLTEHTPKCLLPLGGRPALSHWMDFFDQYGISDVLVNTHHLADQVARWAAEQNSRVKIRLAYEPELLGTAGTVALNWNFVRGEQSFLIFYADNLVVCDLRGFIASASRRRDPLSLVAYPCSDPKGAGIVTVEEDGRVTCFEEKPAHPKSTLANAGIYLARPSLFEYLPASGRGDLGKDVLPLLVGNMSAVVLENPILDIGTLKAYQYVSEHWRSLWPPVYAQAEPFKGETTHP